MKILNRLKEGSTWAAVAAVIAGSGALLNIGGADEIAQVVTETGEVFTGSGDIAAAAGLFVAGILGIVLKDRGADD